jgi:hypothetical protein
MDYNRNYFLRAANGFSQLGHWLIGGGNTDIAMSAKTHWKSINGNKWFQKLEQLLNFTFKFIDGGHHCFKAYEADSKEDYTIGDTLWCDISISVIQVVFCLILIIPFVLVSLIKKSI